MQKEILNTEIFSLNEEKNKIKVKKDLIFPNLAIFRLAKEDHTIGNVIHQKLLTFKDVLFCAYKKPHPLENFVIFKIMTNENLTPFQALDCCLKDLYIELSVLEEELDKLNE